MVSFPFIYSIGRVVGLHECGVILLESDIKNYKKHNHITKNIQIYKSSNMYINR